MINNYHCSYRVIFVCYHYIGQSAVVAKPISLIPDKVGGNPRDILRSHYIRLIDVISTNLHRITDELYTKELIPQYIRDEMHKKTELTDGMKSNQLLLTIQMDLEKSSNPDQYLIDICHVLINQQHQTLTDIATYILHQLGGQQLGECVCYMCHVTSQGLLLHICHSLYKPQQ